MVSERSAESGRNNSVLRVPERKERMGDRGRFSRSMKNETLLASIRPARPCGAPPILYEPYRIALHHCAYPLMRRRAGNEEVRATLPIPVAPTTLPFSCLLLTSLLLLVHLSAARPICMLVKTLPSQARDHWDTSTCTRRMLSCFQWAEWMEAFAVNFCYSRNRT